MNGPLNLDQRKRLLLYALLNEKQYLTGEALAAISGVTTRTVRNDLKIITDELRDMNILIEASPGLGYRISAEDKQEIRKRLNTEKVFQPVTPDERMFYIIRHLIASPVSIPDLLSRLNISISTWEKDLERCTLWFRNFGLILIRRKNEIRLEGTEEQRNLVFIPFYNEQSRLSGMSIESLLKDDFNQLRLFQEGLDSFILDMKLDLNYEEYTGILIFMLAASSRGSECRARFDAEHSVSAGRLAGILTGHFRDKGIILEDITAVSTAGFLGAFDHLSKESISIIARVKKTTAVILSKSGQNTADADLISALSRIVYPTEFNRMMMRSNSPIRIQDLEKQYPEAIRLSVLFLEQMHQLYSYSQEEGELIKVGMCFAAFLERSILRSRKRVAVICSDGIGASQLLDVRLRRTFPNLEIIGIYPKHLLSDAEKENPDFIISTIDLETERDVVVISNYLNCNDYDSIMPFLRKNEMGRELFKSLLSDNRFYTDIEPGKPEDIIRRLCSSAFGSDGSDFEARVLKREAIEPTSVGNLAAIPHAVRGEKAENMICIGILKKPIRWGKENVQIVFLIRLDDPDIDMSAVFESIYSLVSDKQLIKRIIREQNYSLLLDTKEW